MRRLRTRRSKESNVYADVIFIAVTGRPGNIAMCKDHPTAAVDCQTGIVVPVFTVAFPGIDGYDLYIHSNDKKRFLCFYRIRRNLVPVVGLTLAFCYFLVISGLLRNHYPIVSILLGCGVNGSKPA